MVTKIVQLPNGLSVNGDVVREVEILKLGGPQEDMIRDKKNLREGNVLDKLLKSCIVRIGDVTDAAEISKIYDESMLMADMTFLLVQVRLFGIGKKYAFDAPCPFCEKIGRHDIDLSTLEVDEQKDEHRGKRDFVATVTDESGAAYAFRFRQLFTRDIRLIESIKQQYPSDKATRELCLQLLEVNGAKADPKMIKTSLDWMARNAIRAEMDLYVGGIDTVLVNECKHCEREFKDNMPVELRDFFYPAADTRRIPNPARTFRSYGGTSLSSPPDGDGVEKPSATCPSTSACST